MQYIYYASTPPNTPATTPLITNCALTYGFVTSITIVLPPGCRGLVGIQIYKNSEQIFPSNPNIWLTGDGLVADFATSIDCTDGNPFVQIFTYNIDALYAHNPEFIFSVGQAQSQPTVVTGIGGVSEEITNNDYSALQSSGGGGTNGGGGGSGGGGGTNGGGGGSGGGGGGQTTPTMKIATIPFSAATAFTVL